MSSYFKDFAGYFEFLQNKNTYTIYSEQGDAKGDDWMATDLSDRVELAALLHDVGKLVLRANPERKTHSVVGRDFLARFAEPEDADILRAVRHHHGSDLKQIQDSADISYLIYEADNLAAGSDRRPIEDGSNGFSVQMPLMSIFNVFGEQAGHQAFYLRSLREDAAVQYPQPRDAVRADVSAYQNLYRDLEANFLRKSPFHMESDELLRVLEAVFSYVPSSTALGEAGDISLYDHLRLTAAYATAMYGYFKAHGIKDYRAAVTGAAGKSCRATNMYLLVSGDISGIQQFIYTIPSKGALKGLRGRSVYLEILLEHVVDEILQACHLSRSSLLYTGGGQFYLLLANTSETIAVLQRVSEQINDWMIAHFSQRLYLAFAWTPCSANEFLGEGTRQAFRRVNEILSDRKVNRYSRGQLQQLFSPTSPCNKTQDVARECAICHTSVSRLQPYPANPEIEVCPLCAGLYSFGERVLDKDILCVSETASAGAVPLPGLNRTAYLSAESLADVQKGMVPLERLYVKNEALTGERLATHLWLGDYTMRDEHGHILEFESLSALSSGLSPSGGIPRLGVLRADVDNLGAAFLAGFPDRYTTLTRMAALSRQLSLFFKHDINALCRGEVNGIGEQDHVKFSLFHTPKKEARKVHIIYSGGDDIFLVGSWDDILELAVDLYRAFQRFTGGKLHFSAGVGLFKSRHPVADMARQAGRLEDAAKATPGKDSLSLFGISDDAMRVETYPWQDFIERVCGEKLHFLQTHFCFAAEHDNGTSRLSFSKAGLYRLLTLLSTEGSIQLARFAYLLARMDPGSRASENRRKTYEEVRRTLYTWYRQVKDRRELLTATELILYGLREKGETSR